MRGARAMEVSGVEMVFEQAWLQRSSASNRGAGAHCWYPEEVPMAIRGLLVELTARGRDQRVSAWIIADGHLAWARAFPATSRHDGQRAARLAVTIARPVDPEAPWRAALPEILARLPLAPPAPPAALGDGVPVQQVCRVTVPAPVDGGVPLPPTEPSNAPSNELANELAAGRTAGQPTVQSIDPGRLARLFDPESTGLARAIYLGGPAYCRNPHHERLPALFARLLSWLPAGEREHPRSGVFVDLPIPSESSATLDRGMLTLLHYLTRAWFCPEPIRRRQPSFPLQAWQLVLDLSARLERPLPDLLGGLGAVAAAWDTAEDLRRYLLEHRILTHQHIEECDRRAPRPLFAPQEPYGGWQWNRILHYWGRSLLPLGDDELLRLAALLAQRIAVDHLFHLDAPERASLPWRSLRRLAYEALIPHRQAARMFRAVTHFLPSIPRDLAEVPIGRDHPSSYAAPT